MSQGCLGLFSWRILTKKKQGSWNFKFVGEKKFCYLNNGFDGLDGIYEIVVLAISCIFKPLLFCLVFACNHKLGISKISPNSQVYRSPNFSSVYLTPLHPTILEANNSRDLYMCMDFFSFW